MHIRYILLFLWHICLVVAEPTPTETPTPSPPKDPILPTPLEVVPHAPLTVAATTDVSDDKVEKKIPLYM